MDKISSATVNLRSCVNRLEDLNVIHFKIRDDELKKELERKAEAFFKVLFLGSFLVEGAIENLENVFNPWGKKGKGFINGDVKNKILLPGKRGRTK